MKKALLILMLLAGFGLNAQTLGEALPETGKEGEYGDWHKVTDQLPDGTAVTYEYRLMLRKKIVVACHYQIEIKNTGTTKFTAIISYKYKDRLVNGPISEKAEVKVKPGNSEEGRFWTQGCKKNKDEPKDMSDFTLCHSCGMDYSIKLVK